MTERALRVAKTPDVSAEPDVGAASLTVSLPGLRRMFEAACRRLIEADSNDDRASTGPNDGAEATVIPLRR